LAAHRGRRLDRLGNWRRALGKQAIIENITQPPIFNIQQCLSLPSPDRQECSRKFDAEWAEAFKQSNHWLDAAIFAFVPIPFAWLLAWGLVALMRWIWRGLNLERAG
jgi:uncharacterized membrane protein